MDKYAYLADREEIRENDYNLNIPRYVDTFVEEEEVDIVAVQKRIEGLDHELAEVRKQISKCLKELGIVNEEIRSQSYKRNGHFRILEGCANNDPCSKVLLEDGNMAENSTRSFNPDIKSICTTDTRESRMLN